MKLALRILGPAIRLLGFIVTCAVLSGAVPVLLWEAWRSRR